MSITFAYPWSAPTKSIELRDPEFQDRKTTEVRVTLRTMMDGSVRSMRKTPATVELILKFLNVTRNKAVEFHDFILASEGSRIKYVDPQGNQWVGFIKTGPNTITTYSPGLGNTEPRKESNELNVEFEGAKL